MDKLKQAKLENYPLFSFNEIITQAKIVKNYDGDTADMCFLYNDNVIHVKARFKGYDAPEKKISPTDPKRLEKKKKGKDAQLRLWQLCTNCEKLDQDHETLINVYCHEFDKYGRLLITAFPINYNIEILTPYEELFKNSINYKMIQEGLGYTYDGGTKNKEFFN